MEDKLVIKGGTPLNGEVQIRGAKNAVSKDMVAALLTEQTSTLRNMSFLEDVEIVSKMIEAHGGSVKKLDETTISISLKEITTPKPKELLTFVGKSRIPILFSGPLLSRHGEAIVPMPGGCNIGERPIDFHLDALKKFGAEIEEHEDYYRITANGRLVGTKIELPYPSVGATEQILFCSVLAEGVTQLKNAAVEPEIKDLIALLQKMGAIIAVDTDRVITITGVDKLRGYAHTAIPDRLEVASWACAAIATNGRITALGAQQMHMMSFLNAVRRIGGEFDITDRGIEFYRAKSDLSSLSIQTDVHPGFSTDYQQPFVVVLTQAHGTSVVHETVYENRFGYVKALNDMGAHIQLYSQCLGGAECRFDGSNYMHSASITGPTKLRGTTITIPDLRGGFSYLIAALIAEGETTLHNYGILGRGYENITEKLKSLGANLIQN